MQGGLPQVGFVGQKSETSGVYQKTGKSRCFYVSLFHVARCFTSTCSNSEARTRCCTGSLLSRWESDENPCVDDSAEGCLVVSVLLAVHAETT